MLPQREVSNEVSNQSPCYPKNKWAKWAISRGIEVCQGESELTDTILLHQDIFTPPKITLLLYFHKVYDGKRLLYFYSTFTLLLWGRGK